MNIRYHNQRCNQARAHLLGCHSPIDLRKHIHVPHHLFNTVLKCRITYRVEVESVEYIPYVIKPIHCLQVVMDNTISYPFKYVDRKVLDDCYARRQMGDDVLIIKEGVITDTYYGNIALWANGKWYTPLKPLLKGTRRQQLLDNNRIQLKDIRLDHINQYTKISVFNAMIPLGKIILNINKVYPSI